ncbi:hypothetical protein HELRODRAFT_185222 [Helobdella robusta]|uniref:ELMO domain-containing protein n=1 Tax=Helobdella robusta TaxID=6412 RepID=T1FMI9_HELRO|nr:hypothetical protein HELRODRAFT_185222 [Helobdella robusta]ESN90675.1 hypothetical protein HELRODRAFT_185222 [Helobdella robusta]
MSGTNDIKKVGITYEDRLPYLMSIETGKSFATVVKELCSHYQLQNPDDYTLYLNMPNCYKFLTDNNWSEIQNGSVLNLVLSVSRQAKAIHESIQRHKSENIKDNLKRLSELSTDETFANAFISIGGLTTVENMIRGANNVDERLSYLLKSFIDLMDFDPSAWGTVDHEFIKIVSNCTNSVRNLENSVVQASLDIIESIIMNCPDMYSIVEQEITSTSLIPHLQSSTEGIQTSALAVFNALFMKGSSEKKRRIVDNSNFKSLRNIILTCIIHRGNPSQGMLRQLHVLQSLLFNVIDEKQNAPVDVNDSNALLQIKELRQIAFDTDPDLTPIAKRQSQLKDFKRLGFQNHMNPIEDFLATPPGLLPLHNMMYFAENHRENYTKVVLENSCRGDDHDMPFAQASIELTQLIGETLKIADQPTEDGRSYHPLFFTNDHSFEEFYCICIQLFNKTWKEMKATVADFTKVIGVVQEQIIRALENQPMTFEQFRNKLSKLTYQEISNLWYQERMMKIEWGLQAEPILELRKQLKVQIIELIEKQRLNYLTEGTKFSLKAYRRQDKFMYCRLSVNMLTLHYGECEENNAPSCEQLAYNVAINEIKDVLVGKDCPHVKDIKKKVANANLAFTIVLEESCSAERADLLNFLAPNEEVFNIWMDGLNILRKRQMSSEDMKRDLDTLLNMEIKLRLLEAEGLTIPDTPPPIPPLPSNFDFPEELL